MSVGVVDKTTGDRIQTAGNPLDKVGNLANLTTTAKDNAVNAINEVNAGLATKADITDLAPAFSTSTAYAVGQYVSYDGNIYKCTSAHSAGAWVAGDFTLVAVGSELSEINSNLTNANSSIAALQTSIKGKVYNTRTVSIPADNWCCAVYCCNINGVGDVAGAVMVQNGAVASGYTFVKALDDMLNISYSNGNLVFEPHAEFATIRSLAVMLS